ncbi:MAG: hypothetical protein EXQ87_01055 [Alphaproteobacteria bacterium]|nr:hypothetical protein [Alphaproteobacteria bacterium]
MSEIDRRTLLTSLAAAGVGAVALAGPTSAAKADALKKEAEIACLYHCDFGDPARFGQLLNNISNHYSVYGANPFDIQLVMVVHSVGVKFFFATLEGTPWAEEASKVAPLFERVAALAKNGLKVYLCEITFERLKLDRDKLRKAEFVSFVPSGVATVAVLQSKGFAYLKVG